MSVAFRAAASDHSNAKSVSKPTGTASGDLLILAVTHYDNLSATVTPPSGFTSIISEVSSFFGDNLTRTEVFWKIAGGSEGSSYSVTISDGGWTELIVAAYTGADGTTPIDTSSKVHINDSSTTTLTIPGVTAARDGSVAFATAAGYSANAWTTPSGFTGRDTGTTTFKMWDEAVNAGATGNVVSTSSGLTGNGILVILQPPGAGAVSNSPISAADRMVRRNTLLRM